MRKTTIVAVAMAAFAAPPAIGQNVAPSSTAAKPAAAASGTTPARAATAKPAASTPESRSAAALALSHEPTFDEGTAERIKQAALSYSDIAVRGGWPTIPADAKFAIGVAGANDDLLRKRLIITGDLADDNTSARVH